MKVWTGRRGISEGWCRVSGLATPGDAAISKPEGEKGAAPQTWGEAIGEGSQTRGAIFGRKGAKGMNT